MRVLMLGWEFPPFISGGLGTACYGLTKALSKLDTDVTFVLPKAVGSDYSSHVKLLSPQSPAAANGDRSPSAVASRFEIDTPAIETGTGQDGSGLENVSFRAVPSRMSSPYPTGAQQAPLGSQATDVTQRISFIRAEPAASADQPTAAQASATAHSVGPPSAPPMHQQFDAGYGSDIHRDALRYAGLCVDMSGGENFDVIHAHDWFTFPAGQAVASATGKPLVVHIHSTEYDRSGEHIDLRVYHLERDGCHAADRVIAVSRRTKRLLVDRYGIPENKIEVIYNGIENGEKNPNLKTPPAIERTDKIVLFLGRVTMQKGPEYFIHAAKKVLEKIDDVKFVMAGTGDKIQDMIELAAKTGIGHKTVFTGFLKGPDVKKVMEMADVYVMPSVSEPFGIAPLEAISNDVPVILSKQSGVSEVIEHALKVDFWDTDEMANKIIAVLRHPPLGATLRSHAEIELRNLTWQGAAERCLEVYGQVAEAAV